MRREESFRDDEIENFDDDGLPDFLSDPLGLLARRWLWMLITLVVGLSATTLFLLRQEPKYASTATVLVTNQQIREDLVRSTVQEDSFQRINALINSLLSLTRLSSLIDEFELYPELSKHLTRAEVAAEMRGNISIDIVDGIGSSHRESARVFAISFESTEPTVAAAVTNKLASMFTDESIRMRTQQAGLATHFLKAELSRAEAALREQSAAIREFKELHRGELPGDLQSNLMKLERLQQQRQSLALQITEGENRMVLLQVQAKNSAPDAPATPTERLDQARANLELMLAEYTERHPSIIVIRRTIERLEAEVAAAPSAPSSVDPIRQAMPAAARRELDELQRQLYATESELAELDARVAQTPSRQEDLFAMQERETVQRENYLEFLRKVQEAELAQSLESAQQGARFSITDPAQPATKPTKARMRYLIVGVFGSLAFSLGIGVLLEALDPVLVNKEQIESLSSLPVLGSVPRIVS